MLPDISAAPVTLAPPAAVPLFAALALVAAATALSAFGMGRRRQAGWAWWAAAVWLVALGLLLSALPALGTPALRGPAQALAAPLLLQWPLLALVGLRRFYARHPWPGRLRSDLLLLALACLLALFGSLLLPRQALWLLGSCSVAVHLYVAAVIFLRSTEPQSIPLSVLGGSVALLAFVPALLQLSGASGLGSEALRAMAAGLGVLVLSFVAFALAAGRTEGRLHDAQRRLRSMATLDTPGAGAGRQPFRDFHELAVAALRLDPPGSAVLLLFDIDHFRQLNDHLGHAAGERALRLVSSTVLEHLRAHDVAGRQGGAEFVLLLRRAQTAHAVGVAGRIVADVQANAAAMQLPLLSLSFGLVQLHEGEDIDGGLRRADQALVEARRQGPSCAVAAHGDEARPVFGQGRRLGLAPG